MSLGISSYVVRTLRERRIKKQIDAVIRDSCVPLCPRCLDYARFATRANRVNVVVYLIAFFVGVVIGLVTR